MVSSGAGRVVPVASVNPANPVTPVINLARTGLAEVASTKAPEAVPGVVNLVNQANKPSVGEGVYTSVSDPAKRGSEAATAQKDWTITRPEAVKEKAPPTPPLSKLLMDFVSSLWQASASVVNDALSDYPKKIDTATLSPNSKPGKVASEVFTYSPTSIAKVDKSLSSDSNSSSTSPK